MGESRQAARAGQEVSEVARWRLTPPSGWTEYTERSGAYAYRHTSGLKIVWRRWACEGWVWRAGRGCFGAVMPDEDPFEFAVLVVRGTRGAP